MFLVRGGPPPLPRRAPPAAPSSPALEDPFDPGPDAAAVGLATPPPAAEPDPLGWGEVGLDGGAPGGALDLGAPPEAPPAPSPTPRQSSPAPGPSTTPVPAAEPGGPRVGRRPGALAGPRPAPISRPGRQLAWLAPAASLVLLVAFA
ncbi:MAG TPA: hypothetical protein VFP65_17530, partial [Anaeromyxobacteraceae bacterium]|nr:hypothetical protein [Anaeromyxobacteraceae bacterium]